MSMGLMEGKRGLVVGVANDHSYAYAIAGSLLREGGQCLFTHLPGERMERRCRKALEQLGIDEPWLHAMDATSDEDLDRVFELIRTEFGTIDYLVHSIAFADREWLKAGSFARTPRAAFLQALDISAYTYVAMANRAAPLMPDGGAMVAMSYYGAEKAVPGYNVMGVAKSALESSTRYLAAEFGARNIRVNTISGGPLRTMSAMAVGGFGDIFDWVEQKAPLQRNVTGTEVGDAGVYLLSDLSTAVTGQVLHVDCGYSAIGI
jgi:enoyl-[acyl-carrier protein] reductase I